MNHHININGSWRRYLSLFSFVDIAIVIVIVLLSTNIIIIDCGICIVLRIGMIYARGVGDREVIGSDFMFQLLGHILRTVAREEDKRIE